MTLPPFVSLATRCCFNAVVTGTTTSFLHGDSVFFVMEGSVTLIQKGQTVNLPFLTKADPPCRE